MQCEELKKYSHFLISLWYPRIVLPRSFCENPKYPYHSGMVKIHTNSKTARIHFLYAIDEKAETINVAYVRRDINLLLTGFQQQDDTQK